MTQQPQLVHDALFYESDGEYVDGLREFAREGLDAGASMLIAVPDRNLGLLKDALHEYDGRVEYVDMRQKGKNPARILPFIQAFIDSNVGRPVRFVGEPIWAGRTAPEIIEGHRHEALINAAFSNAAAHIVCPYDVRGLAREVLDDARRTHPTVLDGGERHCCNGYIDPLVVYGAEECPLAEPSADPVTVPFTNGLADFRRLVRSHAEAAGMGLDRVESFVLAANEAAANTILHAGGTGTARTWTDERAIVCELTDSGRIDDPFVGRIAPPTSRTRGRGVWMMNQLCDLVELRSGPAGTVVRIHMNLQ